MAKITGLSIPSGLEDFFKQVVGVKPYDALFRATLKLPAQNYFKALKTAERSLFRKFQFYYDQLDDTEKSRWQDYWGTLPFGSHAGARGWPGSGYSAFVYINAQKLRANLPMLYYAPGELELCFNGSFTGNANGWTLTNGCTYGSNRLNFPGPVFPYTPANALTTKDRIRCLNAGRVRVAFDLGGTGKLGLAFYAGDSFTISTEPGSGHYSYDFTEFARLNSTQCFFRQVGSPVSLYFTGWLDNVSIKAIYPS